MTQNHSAARCLTDNHHAGWSHDCDHDLPSHKSSPHPSGESLGRRWLKTVLTTALAGILCLVLIGVTRTVSALITGGGTRTGAGQ